MSDQRPAASVTFRNLDKDPETLNDPRMILERIMNEHLQNPGLVLRIMCDLEAQILEGSDHSAYRELADAVTDSIIGDPNDWDGDASELELLVQYLKNARDIARHEVAEELRSQVDQYPADVDTETLWDEARNLDPYQRGDEGAWIRKSDGTVVSWPIVRD